MARAVHLKELWYQCEPWTFFKPTAFHLVLLVSKFSFKHDLPKHLRTNWNYVCCQTILDHWPFYQEVLGTIGALSNFRGVAVWGRGLWQELLRGRESIRQGSLQSGQLLKMQQHHYSLTQPTTLSPSLHHSLFPFGSLSPFFPSFFFWILFSTAICSLLDISHCTLLRIPFSPLSSFLSPSSTYFSITELAGVSLSHPSVHALTQWSFFTPIQHSEVLVSVGYCTGTRIEQPTENNKWTYMGG